jgi:hypothetical protein
MEITELQNVKVYRVRDDMVTDEMIIIMDEGELQFYTEIELKYSYFEKAKLEAEEGDEKE